MTNAHPGPFVLRTDRGGAGQRYELGPVVSLGRAPDSTIISTDPSASRRHAEIRANGERYVLYDLSRFGTSLNRRRISGPTVLRDGDRIHMPGLELIFRESDGTLVPLHGKAPRDRGLIVDEPRGTILVEGREVSLTPKEMQVFLVLDSRRGHIVSKSEIATAAWPEYDGGAGDDSVEQHVRQIREKIERDPAKPNWLLTRRGRGYELKL